MQSATQQQPNPEALPLAGVLLVSPDARILFADAAACVLLGIEAAPEGRPLEGAVYPEAAGVLAALLARDTHGSASVPVHGGEAAVVSVAPVDQPDGTRLGHMVRVLRARTGAAVAATRQALVNRVERALARARRRTDYGFGLLWIDFPPAGGRESEEDDLRVVEVLQDAVRPMDLAARLGSGRFGVLLHGLGDEVDAFHIARRMHLALERCQECRAGGGARDAAIGVVLSADAATADVLFRNAEAAAALSRWERGRVAAFEPRRHLRASQQLRVEHELPAAVAESQLRLLYQPIVAVGDRRVVGFEALVRWQHPQDGLLHPDRFVPAAERAGLIAELDLWVLRVACERARGWLDAGVLPADGFVSVNLSGRTLDRDDTAERVLAALSTAGLAPARLQVEITETALVERTDVANATLLRLREAGARVAIDDFGSGYCSLAYLQRLPVDALKLDRSLLRGRAEARNGSGLLEGVMALARCMSLPVTVEGVETPLDLTFLAELDGGHAQGFAFAPPLDAEAAAAYAVPLPLPA